MSNIKNKLIYDTCEKVDIFKMVKEEGLKVQIFFNKGQYIYNAKVKGLSNSDYVIFDMNGIEDTHLLPLLDFYNQVLFVFYHGPNRYQFVKNTNYKNSHLVVPIPEYINILEGRKAPRIILKNGVGKVKINDIFYDLLETSLGGFSFWLDAENTNNINSKEVFEKVLIEIDDLKFETDIQAMRIEAVAENGQDLRKQVGCRFINTEQNILNKLQNKLSDLK